MGESTHHADDVHLTFGEIQPDPQVMKMQMVDIEQHQSQRPVAENWLDCLRFTVTSRPQGKSIFSLDFSVHNVDSRSSSVFA